MDGKTALNVEKIDIMMHGRETPEVLLVSSLR